MEGRYFTTEALVVKEELVLLCLCDLIMEHQTVNCVGADSSIVEITIHNDILH